MSVLRNDLQVALNDLHVALLESADHYRYSAEFVDEPSTRELFTSIAQARDILTKETEQAIRTSGDLPSVPDVDRKTGEQLLERLAAAFSSDQTAELINQRLAADTELEQLLQTPELAIIDKSYSALRRACWQSINTAKDQLMRALD